VNTVNRFPVGVRVFGEMSVIVAGVLIALTADSWLQHREDRKAEVEHLEALSDEFRESLDALGAAVAVKESQIADLGRFLNHRVADLHPDSIEGWVYNGIYVTGGYVPLLSALLDVESSGGLRLLEDPEIRRGLATLNVTLERVSRSYDEYVFYHQTVVDPYIATELPIVAMLAEPNGIIVDGYAPSNWSPLDEDRARGLLAFKLSLAGNYISNLRLLETQFRAVELLLDSRLETMGAR
jgi:hypothetical protein